MPQPLKEYISFSTRIIHYSKGLQSRATHKGCLKTLSLKCAFVRTDLVVKIAQAAVALGGAVELCDLWYIEAVGEFLPDGLAKAVTESHADLVLVLRVLLWLVQQVAADLANVLHDLRAKMISLKNELP